MILEKTDVQHPVETFLAALRHATAPMHAALEATPLSTALLEKPTLQTYTAYLHRMRDVIRFCEQQVFPLINEVIPDLEQRRKLHLIEADLAQRAPHHAPFSNPYAPFETADTAFALGYMYVIEGSTLGGRIILKQLASKLGMDETSGGTFFAGYGRDTSAKWKCFLELFCTYITEHNAEERAIAGAQHAFTSIAHHFSRP